LVEGCLLKFIDKRFKGDIFHTTVYPGVSIGGLMPSRETIPIKWDPLPNLELNRAFLEIGVISPRESIDWKVKVNGMNLTREFKPMVSTRLGDKIYSKHVFDITSILKIPENRFRNRINVTFKREGGSVISIEHIGLIALFETDEAETNIKYYSGSISLDIGENTILETNYDHNQAYYTSSIYVPSRIAKLKIKLGGGKEIFVTGVQGMHEEYDVVTTSKIIDSIEYEHVESSEKYAPKEIVISNLLLYHTIHANPDIHIDEIDVPETSKGELNISMKLSNRGESKPDKLLISIMDRVEVIRVVQIEPLKPGEERTINLKLNLQPGEHNLVFRVIWRKLSRTMFKEERRKVIVS